MYKNIAKFAAFNTRAFLFVAASVSLAACSAEQLAADNEYVPAAHYEQYPINVAKAPIKMEIASQRGGLQPSQINAIAGFARSAKSAAASKITIGRPSSGGVSAQVANQAYQLLLQSGIPGSMIVRATYPGSSKGPVQISYLRTVAVTKECGDWSSDLADTSSNAPSSNLGCAIQNNIAAQVVNPEDFIIPRATTPALAVMRNPLNAGGGSSTTSSGGATSSTGGSSGSP